MFDVQNPESLAKPENLIIWYYSHAECNVCKVLRPRLEELIKEKFPRTSFNYIDVNLFPALAAQNLVFTVPVIIAIYNSQELFRLGRNFSVSEFENKLQRVYSVLEM